MTPQIQTLVRLLDVPIVRAEVIRTGQGRKLRATWLFHLEGGRIVRLTTYQMMHPGLFQREFLRQGGVFPERVTPWEEVIRLILDITRPAALRKAA